MPSKQILRSARALPALCAALFAHVTPAHANSAALPFTTPASAVQPQLSRGDRAFYHDVFTAIEQQQWGRVESLLSTPRGDPLHQLALAQYYLHPDSPQIGLERLNAWLANGRTLPQAEQIGQLAIKRGLESGPQLPGAQRLVALRAPAKRTRPSAISDGTMPDEIAYAITDRIKNDDPSGARQLLDGVDASLSSEARAEWRQRVAWSYYIENDDANALTFARQVANGGTGPWVGEGWWVAGLAAWRLNDCELAADGFTRAGQTARNDELRAAALYWSSRAMTRCRMPERAADALREAARLHETLYGMLAAEQLGMPLPAVVAEPGLSRADWQRLADQPNVRTAIALVEIGRDGLADEVLRHQASIGDARDYTALSRLARDLGLPATQLYMAYNAPSGARPDPATRFPAAKWAPVDGWRVDPSLAYAHTLQESNFRTAVVSPAGAVGLMQIMPITARHHTPALGRSAESVDLSDPSTNLAFGQRHLEMLRDSSATHGVLPKIMAAYNAGETPVARWNIEVKDYGDPLLYMESIPYWETRGYVAIVTRNYWMYERQAGRDSDTRRAYAQNLWPRFPGVAGADAVRFDAKPVLSGKVARRGG